MTERFGLILIDNDEVIIRIYAGGNKRGVKLLRYHSHDLASFTSGKSITASEIIEIIARTSLSGESMHIAEWKICARNVSETIIQDITYATGFTVELLTLHREQELLCKGMLMELQ